MNTVSMMRLAIDEAWKSPDLSTQNGAILVGQQGNIIGYGCNRPPDGVGFRPDRPEKYAFTEHAERNAIFHAATYGYATQGSTLYALWAACADCGRAIIQAGITRVVTMAFYPEQQNEDVNSRWADTIGDTGTMFDEAGVELEFWTPPSPLMADGFEGLRFNGEMVKY